jgi:hypothetical protein
LKRHAGRFALSAADILRMAIAGKYFNLVAVYSPVHGAKIETGPAAAEIVTRAEKVAPDGTC